MTPIERLEALAKRIESLESGSAGWLVVQITPEIRAVIAEIKKRDEAVRKVAESLEWEDVGYVVAYAARLREALEEK